MGRPQTPETRKKISAALKGQLRPGHGFQPGFDPRRKTIHRLDCKCPWHHDSARGCKEPMPLASLLMKDAKHRRGGQAVKQRLLKEGIKEDYCEVCGLGNRWNDRFLVLQLDHINGVKTDWRIENLRIICPNCHSQTSTFTGKNTKRG